MLKDIIDKKKKQKGLYRKKKKRNMELKKKIYLALL